MPEAGKGMMMIFQRGKMMGLEHEVEAGNENE